MKRALIVNADDCNLTPGVTRAILECHDRGILTSTTFMVNLPVDAQTVRELKRRKNLGVGIHLNVTLGAPVEKTRRVRSLLEPGSGTFRKRASQLSKFPEAGDLAKEYRAQIERFIQLFGRRPTHLDTHHQLHDYPFFLKVLIATARSFRLPVRRSKLFVQKEMRSGIRTTDFFFGNLSPEGYWRQRPLETVLTHLPEGVSEIMCHPGKNDAALAALSTFTKGREAELRLFSSPGMHRLSESLGISRSHFGLCYT